MTDWIQWHKDYDDPDSSLSARLAVVRKRIAEALNRAPAGAIRVASMCAGEGRDLLGALPHHPRAGDVSGRLVELNPQLAEQERAAAPSSIEVLCADAGNSDAYAGVVPVDLLLCCGVFGNITEADIQNTIHAWPMLCAPGATVIWTRGSFEPDLRPQICQWVREVGFEELSFDGANEKYGVGVAKMTREANPYQKGTYLFSFVPRNKNR